MTRDVVEIRPPRITRIFMIAFSVVWCLAVAGAGIRALDDRPGTSIVALLMLLAGGTVARRISRLAVVARAH